MKTKFIELLGGGIPFFLLTSNGNYKINKTRVIESILIAFLVCICTTMALSVYTLPVSVGRIETKLEYIKNENQKTQELLTSMQIQLNLVENRQQERIRREKSQVD